MSDLVVEPVHGRRLFRQFLHLPWAIYRGNPYWVPPLLAAQKQVLSARDNPFFEHAEMQSWLVVRNGRPCGRIAAIVDRAHNEYHHERTGMFGFFEVADDLPAAKALLDTAADWLAGKGMDRIRGPLSPSLNHEAALLVEGFDSSPAMMMSYNPPYYLDLLERAGFQKVRDLYAYVFRRDMQIPGKIFRVAERVRNHSHVVIRDADMSHFKDEVARLREIYNSAWARNWGFVPVTEREFMFLADGLRHLAVPELVLVAEIEGRAVAFMLSLPDVNPIIRRLNGRLFPLGVLRLLWGKRRMKVFRIITMGVVPEYQHLGIPAVFYAETLRRGRALGYDAAELSWVLEDNEMMIRVAEMMAAERYKTYRLLERPLR